jgi:uncharacterized caspase-like protein
VQQHEDRALNLRYTESDVKELRRVLVERAGLYGAHILQMTDGTPDRQPTLANLQSALPEFLEKAAPEDRVIVFFSGHGCRYQDQTYLVPRDFKRTDPGNTGLPIAQVREALGRCKAQSKLLILDCCHAADDKSVEKTASAEAVAKAVDAGKSVRNCVVLASCRDDEESMEWDARKQGVFTYWLCRGLEGAAADDAGKVTVSLLNKYVHERVTDTVEQMARDRHQTPVQFSPRHSHGTVPVHGTASR